MSMEGPREWLQSFKQVSTNFDIDKINNQSNENSNQCEFHKIESKKAQIISITGGKGGVGKTSIAIKMSQLLANSKSKVLLIDMDTNLSNTSIKLGVPINNDFYSLLTNEK